MIWAIVLGVMLSGLIVWNFVTVYQDHQKTSEIVNFINSQIATAQKAQAPAK